MHSGMFVRSVKPPRRDARFAQYVFIQTILTARSGDPCTQKVSE
jgi:hypothetical protein